MCASVEAKATFIISLDEFRCRNGAKATSRVLPRSVVSHDAESMFLPGQAHLTACCLIFHRCKIGETRKARHSRDKAGTRSNSEFHFEIRMSIPKVELTN